MTEHANAEVIKQRYGDPFRVLQSLERAASQGMEALTEDDLFMCKWLGLYTHRHEPGFFMLRTKQPGGVVTPAQLDVLADIAEKQNKGFADITTRQNIQLHWIRVSDVPGVLKRLESAGIWTRGACGDIPRNIVGCPVAGVDRQEYFDASPTLAQLHELFVGDPAYVNLPRKYKLSVSACREQCTHPEIQCVSLLGLTRVVDGQPQPGFDVRLGGGLSTQPFISQRLGVFIKPEEAVEVVRHITDIWRDSPEYREKRHRARFKFIIQDWGLAKFRQVLEERLGRVLEPAPPDYRELPDTYRDHIGVHAQKQRALYYIGAPVLVGRISSAQMKKVADLSRRYADGADRAGSIPAGEGVSRAAGHAAIRLTVRQNLILVNVVEEHVEKVLGGLADVGLSINAHPIRRSVVTCTGTEFCKLAITETKARSRQVVEHLEKRVRLDEPLRLHITGCPNACAQYQVANIGLMGSKAKVDGQLVDAYDVLIGGRLGSEAGFNHPVLRKIPASDVAKRLEQLLAAYTKQRKEHEPFNDWCGRIGDAEVTKLLSDATAPAAAEEDEDVPAAQLLESDGPVY